MNDSPVTPDNSHTIAELIRSQLNQFSPAEMKIVNHLLANYPMSGMVSITELSESCGVSTPTVMRTLKKSATQFHHLPERTERRTAANPLRPDYQT
ncbi:hypothetical protein [Aliamphritea spongicola]|nr:hypothetical protein [Aliamphritea spongicola]